MKLYYLDDSAHAYKLKIILERTKCEVERVPCKIEDSPLKVLPVLVLPDGDYLFTVTSICRYLWTKCGHEITQRDEETLRYEADVVQPLVMDLLSGQKQSNLSELKEVTVVQDTLASLVLNSTLSLLCSHKDHKENLKSLSYFEQFFLKFSKLLPGPLLLDQSNVERSQTFNLCANRLSDDELGVELSDQFIQRSMEEFHVRPEQMPPRQKLSVPSAGSKNVLITTALPYVNNIPHLGNIVGSVLSADVFARYSRSRGRPTVYIGGTDEYGTATETKALEEGCSPQELCDKYHALHKSVYEWFSIQFDYFGRTSTNEQKEIAGSIFLQLAERGNVFEDSVQQLYCESCPRFLADRFVEGTCPFCAYDDARGDQCDKCSKLINAVDLKNPRCKVCKATPILRSSRHLFLDMPKLQNELQSWLERSIETGKWTQTAKVISRSWIRDGLKPRCITRDLKWGVPVPREGFEDKVFYVWFDAPIGYLSIPAKQNKKSWKDWWFDDEGVELYQFMGKDNVPFHAIFFPMILLGTGEPYTKVNHVMATEYLNYEDTKFSKSRGVGVFGTDVQTTGIDSDVWRFYLMYVRPESQDTSFSWSDLQTKNNSELLNNLGNFLNRCLSFTASRLKGVVPSYHGAYRKIDKVLIGNVNALQAEYIERMENARMRDAIRTVLTISRIGNQYIQSQKPWDLLKKAETKDLCENVIFVALQVCALLTTLLEPFIPTSASDLRKQLNLKGKFVLGENFQMSLVSGHRIGEPRPLFKKILDEDVELLRQRFSGKQN